MKKITALLLIILMISAFVACSGSETPKSETPKSETPKSETLTAEKPTPKTPTPETPTPEPENVVFVTIVDQDGKLALAQAGVSVKDLDANGKLTIDETFVAAHEAAYPEGKAGYATGETQYGVSIFKLWGSDEGKQFSYYLNGQMAYGLTDEVKAGDYLDAYVYVDMTAFSDTYCYFDKRTVSAAKGEEIKLTLSKMTGFDENWAPVFGPADEGVKIVIDGEVSAYALGADGSVTLSFADAGAHVISATSAELEGVNLVPPVCNVTVA